jgi:N-carbamoylputrescine amidase
MAGGVLRVGLVQQACGPDPVRNLAAGLRGVEEAAERGARLVLLPELFTLPYPGQVEDPAAFDLAEPVPGPTTETLGGVARARSVVLVGSVFERRAAGVYHNTAVVLDADGRLAGRYRKMHIPDDPGYQEKFYFAPGDQGFAPVPTSLGPLGVGVCWDQWYPEGARLLALAGAAVLLYPTAIGWAPEDDAAERARQQEAWITVQRAHAIVNALPLLACNRVGLEPDPSGRTAGIQFWGSSFVAGPQGELLARAATDRAEVLVADLDLGRTEELRRTWPWLRDRRTDAYQDLLRRYRD